MIDFSNYIQNYGKEVGLPNLKLNENGVCSLNFDGKINVDIVYNKDNDQCFFASPIGTVPVDGREEFYKQLLLSNAFGIENGGAVLGIEEEEDRVVLSYTFIASTFSFELFKTVLGNFVTMVENWMGKYETLCRVSASSGSSGQDEAAVMPQAFAYARI